MYCKYCGKEIADNSKFCPVCGKEITLQNNQLNNNGLERTTREFVENNKSLNDIVIVKKKSYVKIIIPIIIVIILVVTIIAIAMQKRDNANIDSVKDVISNSVNDISDSKQHDSVNNENKSDEKDLYEDIIRGYTYNTTVDEAEKNEKTVSDEPDYIGYCPIQEEVYNTEKEIYEYVPTGKYDKNKIAFLYYEDVKVIGVQAGYGMTISFDASEQKIDRINYYLTEDEFAEFEKAYRVADRIDNKVMKWDNEANMPQIMAIYYDDFSDDWNFSDMNKSGKGYILSVYY